MPGSLAVLLGGPEHRNQLVATDVTRGNRQNPEQRELLLMANQRQLVSGLSDQGEPAKRYKSEARRGALPITRRERHERRTCCEHATLCRDCHPILDGKSDQAPMAMLQWV